MRRTLCLFAMLLFIYFSNGLSSPRERLQTAIAANYPVFESYWESYDSYRWNYTTCQSLTDPKDVDTNAYGYDLGAVPVISMDDANNKGINIVNIAFGKSDDDTFRNTRCTYYCQPYICGLHLFQDENTDEEEYADLLQDIQDLKAQGAIVKLSVGGEEFGNTFTHFKSTYRADKLIERIVSDAEALDADGVDLAQEQGCGPGNFQCDDQVVMQTYMIEKLRELLGNEKIISYTFPAYESIIDFPFEYVVKLNHQHLDTINAFRATPDSMLALEDLGVPKEKLNVGLAIGCNQSPFPPVSIVDAIEATAVVRDRGYQGIMTWSINRDTNHRKDQNGQCTPYQTGQPDGTFLDTISTALHMTK